MSQTRPANISNLYYGSEATYICGYPEFATVQKLVDSIEQFYEEKVKPTINTFRLFPKLTLKHPVKLTGDLMEKIHMIAQQFQYQDENQPVHHSKKKGSQKNNNNDNEGSLIKKYPIYKLYAPINPVLRQQYAVLSPQIFKKITGRDQQDAMRQRVKQWMQIGYHIHVLQAFKIQLQQNKPMIFIEKVRGRTLRDWLNQGFYADMNKQLNSKRILNTVLQIAVGLNYIHRRNSVHQELIPEHIYIENDKIIKIGNMYNFNGILSKMSKHSFVGSSPEYWSPQQGSIYEGIKGRGKDHSGYISAMKLIPTITTKSDIYQFGLLILEMLHSKRQWPRGDKVNVVQILNPQIETNATKETTSFLIDKVQQMLRPKPQQRLLLKQFIVYILNFYAKYFKNAQDLLWCRFFDEEKYESDLLNNKAVGLYLSGNELECERSWMKSLNSNPLNLTAQYNYSHFRRMKRIIDDSKLNKQLIMLPQSRKRNYYLLISNLVSLSLLKQPFKTFNFNPKLSKHKQIEIISNIMQMLEKFKKPKEFIFQKRTHINNDRFDQCHITDKYFIGRLHLTNTFYAYQLGKDIRSHTHATIDPEKQPSAPEGRQALSCIDSLYKYMAVSDNSYLCIFKIDPLTQNEVYFKIEDYGSSITTIEFDQKSEVLGVGSNEFTIKLFNILTKQVYKTINIGQKFIIKNLAYYDRNTCIAYSYEKSVSFHRIQTTKQLFLIRCNALIVNYKILEISLTSHIMIVHTLEKFEIWNLKDKALIRNIEIDQAPKIEGFTAFANKKLVIHFTKNAIRIWNYSNGLILKTYRTPINIHWVHADSQIKYLRSLDNQGNLVTRYIDFSDFLKNFEGICIPNQICLTDQRQDNNDEITQYVRNGRELIENLNEYRLNEQEKKVSLEKMYKISQTIKSNIFYQDKPDIKAVFLYLNSIKQSQDRSSRINGFSEEYVFMSRKEQFVTATSNFNENSWLIGESDGHIRLVSAPDTIHFTIRPKLTSVTFLYLQPTSIFIGYNTTCFLVQRQSLNIVVTHSSYHKKPIRMGLVLNNILATGDQDQLILFWNKEKVRRYKIPVNLADIVGKKLIVAGFDNRIRLYDMHPDNGIQKSHVFVGHVMSIFNMVVIDDGIFTTYSYDGSIRWWNIQAKTCFSFFNFKKYFPNDKILYVDMPKFSLQQEKMAKFDREGCALILLNNSQIVVFDTMRKEVKWKLELVEDIVRVFWTQYPNTFAVVTYQDVRIINIYWRYMVLKR